MQSFDINYFEPCEKERSRRDLRTQRISFFWDKPVDPFKDLTVVIQSKTLGIWHDLVPGPSKDYTAFWRHPITWQPIDRGQIGKWWTLELFPDFSIEAPIRVKVSQK